MGISRSRVESLLKKKQKEIMKHLFEIDESGEVYAADDALSAESSYKEMTGNAPKFVLQLRDDIVVPENCEDREIAGKTYAQVANICTKFSQVFTTYR